MPKPSATKHRSIFFVTALLLFTACQSHKLEPAALSPEDMCTACKMAISEKQFAAQYLTKDGDAVKFDDLGCLARYLKGHPQQRADIAAFFVMDYETKQWLKAESAFFVHADKFQTPMSGGFAAFNARQPAEAEAAAKQGRLLTWQEVLASAK